MELIDRIEDYFKNRRLIKIYKKDGRIIFGRFVSTEKNFDIWEVRDRENKPHFISLNEILNLKEVEHDPH